VSHPLRVRRPNMRAPLDGAVLVARPSRWGNPYSIEEYGRKRAIEMYEQWLLANDELLAQLPSLKGKRLACYCKLDEPCHADVLARLANE
jgi:hypothetical protein